MTIADPRAAGAEPRYRDASLSVGERVDDLLARMTREEKLAQLGSLWVFEILDGRDLDPG